MSWFEPFWGTHLLKSLQGMLLLSLTALTFGAPSLFLSSLGKEMTVDRLSDFRWGQQLAAEMQSRSPGPVVLRLSFCVLLPVPPLLWNSPAHAGVLALTLGFSVLTSFTVVDFTEGQSLVLCLSPGLWTHSFYSGGEKCLWFRPGSGVQL